MLVEEFLLIPQKFDDFLHENKQKNCDSQEISSILSDLSIFLSSAFSIKFATGGKLHKPSFHLAIGGFDDWERSSLKTKSLVRITCILLWKFDVELKEMEKIFNVEIGCFLLWKLVSFESKKYSPLLFRFVLRACTRSIAIATNTANAMHSVRQIEEFPVEVVGFFWKQLEKFYEEIERMRDSFPLLFGEVVAWELNGREWGRYGGRNRKNLWKIFNAKRTEELLAVLQDDKFLVESVISGGVDELDEKEKEFFFKKLLSASFDAVVMARLVEGVREKIEGEIGFFKKTFNFSLLMLALVGKIGILSEREKSHLSPTLLEEGFLQVKEIARNSKNGECGLGLKRGLLFDESASPFPSSFLFCCLMNQFRNVRDGEEKPHHASSMLSELDDALQDVIKRCFAFLSFALSPDNPDNPDNPSGVTIDTKKERIVYEQFCMKKFRLKYKKLLENDQMWMKIPHLFSPNSTNISSVEQLFETLKGKIKVSEIGLIMLWFGFHHAAQEDYFKGFNFVSSVLNNHVKKYPLPSQKYAEFAKSLMFELCMIFVNELSTGTTVNAVLREMQSLSKSSSEDSLSITSSSTRINQLIFYFANLTNFGMITHAVEHAKNFLFAAGKKRDFAYISTLKIIYNTLLCISVILGGPTTNGRGNEKDTWDNNTLSLLTSSSESLLRGLCCDEDKREKFNLFKRFISLFQKERIIKRGFLGLFAGYFNMQLSLSESVNNNKYTDARGLVDALVLEHFASHYISVFTNNVTIRSSTVRYFSIESSNQRLSIDSVCPSIGNISSSIRSHPIKLDALIPNDLILNVLVFMLSNDIYDDQLALGEILLVKGEYLRALQVFTSFLTKSTGLFGNAEEVNSLMTEGKKYSILMERIVCCLIGLGGFDDALLASQLLSDKRTAFSIVDFVIRHGLIGGQTEGEKEKSIIDLLWDIDIVEYLLCHFSYSCNTFLFNQTSLHLTGRLRGNRKEEKGFDLLNIENQSIHLLREICLKYLLLK